MLDELYKYVLEEPNVAFQFVMDKETPTVLYGAGNALYFYVKFLRGHGIEPYAISDRNAQKMESTELFGIKVKSIDELRNKLGDFRVLITAPKFRKEIRADLYAKYSLQNVFEFETEIYVNFIHDIEKYREFIIDHFEKIEKVYSLFEDDLSRLTFVNMIKGRISANQDYFTDILVPNQYLQRDLMTFTDSEVMVELGSYDGETLKEFIDFTNNRFSEIYCFEPDPDCYKKLESQTAGDERIHLLKTGAWNEKTVLRFNQEADFGTSKVTDSMNDTIEVPVDTVDHLVKSKVTFLKMDIEGSEINAIKGARTLIEDNYPKLAVCVYHNQGDLFEIPLLIKNLNSKYKLYLRHHNYGATDTVLYARV